MQLTQEWPDQSTLEIAVTHSTHTYVQIDTT